VIGSEIGLQSLLSQSETMSISPWTFAGMMGKGTLSFLLELLSRWNGSELWGAIFAASTKESENE
jgi:hypothetical protein